MSMIADALNWILSLLEVISGKNKKAG
jgi:hypothetical protein